jgi:exodeoxyribonuclease-3
MKIISWNVNWIRAVNKKWFKDFVKSSNPDILCIQETKAFEEQFLKEVWILNWYDYVWHKWTRAWYAWTAIFYKNNINVIDNKNHFWKIEHFNSDWRITEIELNDFVLINWYFPNWWTRANWDEMLNYKLEFYDHIIDYCNKLVKSWKNVIITGDFNICHKEIDIARPEANKNSIWFLPIERDKIWELIKNWFTDIWRKINPNKLDTYSWWSYRAWARPRNVWWRLDYFMVNDDYYNKSLEMEYLTDIMWSDHCPIQLIIK